MNNHFLNINHLLLLLFFVVTSCNGQVKRDQHEDNTNQQTSVNGDQSKIVLAQGATSGSISCELQDRDGNLWFSTSGEGIYRFDGKSFTNFTAKDGLSHNKTSTIIQDKLGNILIGTNAGICKFDGKIFTEYFEADSLKKIMITSLLEDRDGNLWFGVVNKGVYRYDGRDVTNFIYKYEHPFYGEMYEKFISDIIQDKNGNIWFSSWNAGGVKRYDGKNLENFLPSLDYYKSNQDKRGLGDNHNFLNITSGEKSFVQSEHYISDDMIFSLKEDKTGNIWFATRNHGACRFDGKTFTVVGAKEGILSEGANAILEDKKGVFWFGTEKNGVWSYDGKTFKNFNEKDGLVNNAVMSIFEDREGNLWFGTKWFGLSRYDGKTFTTFSHYDN